VETDADSQASTKKTSVIQAPYYENARNIPLLVNIPKQQNTTQCSSKSLERLVSKMIDYLFNGTLNFICQCFGDVDW